MLLKLPNGTIEIGAEPHDVLIIAVPKHLNVTRVRTFPGETHRAITVRGSDTVKVASPLVGLIEKHRAYATSERLFLAAATFLAKDKKTTIACSDVRAVLEDAGFKQVKAPSATLAVLVAKKLCKRTGRGEFSVTKAGHRFLASKPTRYRR
jgi:hypothetical protein